MQLDPFLFQLLQPATTPIVATRWTRGDGASTTAAHAAKPQARELAVHPAVAKRSTIPAARTAAASPMRRKRRDLLPPGEWQLGRCSEARQLHVSRRWGWTSRWLRGAQCRVGQPALERGTRQWFTLRRCWGTRRRGLSHPRWAGWSQVRWSEPTSPA